MGGANNSPLFYMERRDKRVSSDNLYNQTWKNLANEYRGQRKGQLWRSELDWKAAPNLTETPEDLTNRMKGQAKIIQEVNKTKADKGWTAGRTLKYQGSIPFEVFLMHPELWYDDRATDRFLKENKSFAMDSR